jgi:hypothetical protein
MLLVGSSLAVFLQCFVGHGPQRTPNTCRPQWTSTKCFLYEFLLVAKVAIIWIYVSKCRVMGRARMNQQSPMHQLAIVSTGWVEFFHLAPNGVHHIPFLFAGNHSLYFSFSFLFVLGCFFPGHDLTHSYLIHLPTLISTAPTLVPYLLSLTDIATLITSYLINLVTILTTYLTNLMTLLT